MLELARICTNFLDHRILCGKSRASAIIENLHTGRSMCPDTILADGTKSMQKKSGNDLFIVDNSDAEWKVLSYLSEWSDISSRFDIATGYFEVGSLLALDGKWGAHGAQKGASN
jgi:hypothetical protein